MSQQNQPYSSKKSPSINNKQISCAEKISFTISLAILSFIISLLIYSWVTGENNPPVLIAKIDGEIRQVDTQFYVPFAVTNTGGQTVESVEIVAELKIKEEVVETGSQQIDFLSKKEEESGAFIFSQNPDSGQLTVRVASYKLP